jgi:hypothetical protein
MKAIKIKVDFESGKRAGGINPRSKNLRGSSSWQDTDAGWEIRMVLDENVERYRNVTGVTVLEDEAAIEAELAASFPSKTLYKVTNEALLSLSLQQLNPDLSDLPQEATHDEELAFLYAAGAKGIGRIVRARATAKRVAGVEDEDLNRSRDD